MSGDLVAESTSDVGATFVLTLPRGGASLNAHSSTKAPRDSSAPISAA
jgi:hypothetical protein